MKYKNIPVWAFHGALDNAVPISMDKAMIAAIKKIGGDVKFTIYDDTGHDAWTKAYTDPSLYEWFIEHTLSTR